MKLFFICAFCIFLLTGCSSSISENKSYNSERLSFDEPIINHADPIEEQIASFSTEILRKDPDRQTNITIACNSLNGLIVKSR